MGVRRALCRQLEELWLDSQSRPLVLMVCVCLLSVLVQMYCISASRSLVLIGSTWLTLFCVLSLVAGLVWLAIGRSPPSAQFSYGLSRSPVLTIFASTVLAQLAALFLVKESVERLLDAESHVRVVPILGGAVSPIVFGAAISSCSQFLSLYAIRNEPLTYVLTASASSWLQEHAADLAHALCQFMPGLSHCFLLKSITTKKIPPARPVITPTGIS